MNQRDGFTGGFLAGAVVGGLVGGVLGALLTSQRPNTATDEELRLNVNPSDPKNIRGKRRQIKASSSEQGIETARRSLEDKIAQLNETIDEVRLTLGNVNGNLPEEKTERPFIKDL